jgi:hypothetical protein
VHTVLAMAISSNSTPPQSKKRITDAKMQDASSLAVTDVR